MASAAIYTASVLLSGLVLLTSSHTEPAFHETQWYAGAAFLFLYLTLLTGAVAGTTATRVETGPQARRALGVSACWFALLHSYFGFYRFVGGFEGYSIGAATSRDRSSRGSWRSPCCVPSPSCRSPGSCGA